MEYFSSGVFPPAAVYVVYGFSQQFWINILLTCLGGVLGFIHAMMVILPRDYNN